MDLESEYVELRFVCRKGVNVLQSRCRLPLMTFNGAMIGWRDDWTEWKDVPMADQFVKEQSNAE